MLTCSGIHSPDPFCALYQDVMELKRRFKVVLIQPIIIKLSKYTESLITLYYLYRITKQRYTQSKKLGSEF